MKIRTLKSKFGWKLLGILSKCIISSSMSNDFFNLFCSSNTIKIKDLRTVGKSLNSKYRMKTAIENINCIIIIFYGYSNVVAYLKNEKAYPSFCRYNYSVLLK
jgi:hypothetical protein